MRQTFFIFSAALLSFCVASCGGATAPKPPTNAPAANPPAATTANSPTNSAPAAATAPATSPTAEFSAYVTAARKPDLPAMEAHLSRGTIEMIKETAAAEKVTPNTMLLKMSRQVNAAPETRNEQIAGETASIELKNDATGSWDKIPFVNEGGRWKIALDKLVDDAIRQAEAEDAAQSQNSNIAK